jgi:hypothetical protein
MNLMEKDYNGGITYYSERKNRRTRKALAERGCLTCTMVEECDGPYRFMVNFANGLPLRKAKELLNEDHEETAR